MNNVETYFSVLFQHVAMAAFFLACKVEECPLKLKEIVHAFFLLNQSGNPTEAVAY